jgi:hypothetical protein
MKKLLVIALGFLLIMPTSQAFAISIDFSGGFFTFSDNPGDPDTFKETLTFTGGEVDIVDPADTIFTDAGTETVVIAPLILDPSNPYHFSPTTYTDGFTILDDNGDILLQADLEVQEIAIVGGTGVINPSFTVNLTNITSDLAPGTSSIIDAFLNPGLGAVNFTLNISSGNLGSKISSGSQGGSINGTFSGSAAPVPEPTTMLLLGSGLVGLRFFSKKRS